MILNKKKFRIIAPSCMVFVIFISILYVDYKGERIESFFLRDVDAQKIEMIYITQKEYNTTYYYLNLLPEQKEFLKQGMKDNLPNEVAYCLYGEIIENRLEIRRIYDGTLKSTPISTEFWCESTGDYLMTVHSHPDSHDEWECFPSNKDLYSVADNSLKLNGIMCFDEPKIFLTDINSELLDVIEL